MSLSTAQRRVSFGFAAALAALTNTATAASNDKVLLVERACVKAAEVVNARAAFTSTTCESAQGHDGLYLVFVSIKPVFSDPEKRKTWLLAVAWAAGRLINENPSAGLRFIIVFDVDTIMRDTDYFIPAGVAASLQRERQIGTLDMSGFWAGINRALQQAPPASNSKDR